MMFLSSVPFHQYRRSCPVNSQFDYPFADLRGKQRAHLVRSLNDPAIFSLTDCEPDLRHYGLRAICLAVALWLLVMLWMAGFGDPVDGLGWNNWTVVVAYALLVAPIAYV